MTRVVPLTPHRIEDLEQLFSTDGIADRCWCMWYTTRVADFHAAGRKGNRAAFIQQAKASPTPMGVIAYEQDEPVGWCGVGPRARYERALKTPTLKGRDPSEDEDVWLVTCFFEHGAKRIPGVSRALLQGAIELARARGAKAIEGFPDALGKRSERGARGAEPLFAQLGFSVVSRPSAARVIMRRELP